MYELNCYQHMYDFINTLHLIRKKIIIQVCLKFNKK